MPLSRDAHRSLVVTALCLLMAVPTLQTRGAESTPSEPAPAAQAPKPALTTIRVQSVQYISFAPFFIAQDEGFFADEGLDVKFVSMSRGFDGIPALAQGNLDVWAGGVNAGLFNVIARGADIRIVADKGYARFPDDPSYTLVIRTDLVKSGKVSGAKDLKGLRFSDQPATPSEYSVDRLLTSAGLNSEDIEKARLGNDLLPQAMAEGTIDAVLMVEPWVTMIIKQGSGVAWKRMAEVTPDFQYGVVAFGPTLLRKNPEAGTRFMRAYLRALRQYSLGKTERNLEILARHTQLDADLLKEVAWPFIHVNGRPGLDSLVDFQKWAVERDYLDAVLQPEQFWDPRFVEAAEAGLETVAK